MMAALRENTAFYRIVKRWAAEFKQREPGRPVPMKASHYHHTGDHWHNLYWSINNTIHCSTAGNFTGTCSCPGWALKKRVFTMLSPYWVPKPLGPDEKWFGTVFQRTVFLQQRTTSLSLQLRKPNLWCPQEGWRPAFWRQRECCWWTSYSMTDDHYADCLRQPHERTKQIWHEDALPHKKTKTKKQHTPFHFQCMVSEVIWSVM